jgi:hypothetical protein
LLNLASAKIKIAAILILSLAIFGGGYKVAQWRYSAIIADIKTELSEGARIAEKAAKAHADIVVTKAEAVKSQREIVYKTITKEVIKYVQDPNFGKCVIPGSWVQQHDSAASVGMPGSAP